MLLGDALITLDGLPVTGADVLLRMLGADAIGRTMAARILRNGRFVDISVTPIARPAKA